VNLSKHLFNKVLHAMGDNGSAQNIELVPKGIGYLHPIASARSVEVFLIFFGH
jgi:hypothetical protein